MKFIALTIALMASSAFATEFSARIDNIDCKISNGVVSRTQSFGKDMKASFTETKTVSMKGTEAFIRLATETASQLPASENSDFSYTMSHEGKTYYLDVDDSKETMYLIRMITKICR